MPFIVDSVTMAIERRHSTVQLAIHPIVAVRRTTDGNLLGVAASGDPSSADGYVHTEGERRVVESFVHMEIDRIDDTTLLAELVDDLRATYADVHAATNDWSDMLAVAFRVVNELGAAGGDADRAETRALLQWMADHHFTFLGVCDIVPTDDDRATIVEGSALGVLRNESGIELTPFPGSATLVVNKEPQRSRVHRDVYLDAVAVRSIDPDGRIARESASSGCGHRAPITPTRARSRCYGARSRPWSSAPGSRTTRTPARISPRCSTRTRATNSSRSASTSCTKRRSPSCSSRSANVCVCSCAPT